MPRPEVASTAISWPTSRGMRSSLTASATTTLPTSACSTVAGRVPTCTLRTITCWPATRVGTGAVTALISGQELLCERGGVGRAAPSREQT